MLLLLQVVTFFTIMKSANDKIHKYVLNHNYVVWIVLLIAMIKCSPYKETAHSWAIVNIKRLMIPIVIRFVLVNKENSTIEATSWH